MTTLRIRLVFVGIILLMGFSFGMPAHGDAPLTPVIVSCKPALALESGIFVLWLVDSRGAPATDVDLQYRKVGTEAWTDAGITGVEQISTEFSNLEYDTTYEVQIRASNADGTSAWSVSSTATTPVENKPPKITGPLAVEIAENTNDVISVTWTDPDGSKLSGSGVHALHGGGIINDIFVFDGDLGEGIYRFRFKQAPDFEIPFPNSGNGNVYTAELFLATGWGERRLSIRSRVTVTVLDVDEPPAKPKVPIVTGTTAHSAALSWDAPANTGPAITDYDVQYRGQKDAVWMNILHNSAETKATLTGLEGDTVYEFRVRAVNEEGEGAWSDVGTVITKPRPGSPHILDLRPPTDQNFCLYLLWYPSLGKVTRYEIQYRKAGVTAAWVEWPYTDDGSKIPRLTSRYTADRDELVTGLEGDTVYEFRVRAINDDGVSFWSDIKSGTPRGANQPPTITSPTDVKVAENTTPLIPVTWTDADGDEYVSVELGPNLTYFKLGAGDNPSNFGIQVRKPMNFESPQDWPDAEVEGDAGYDNVYFIYVTVVTGRGERERTTKQRITITVTDVDEPPSQPDAPEVYPVSAARLGVKWIPPKNTGPEMVYDVRFRPAATKTKWTTILYDEHSFPSNYSTEPTIALSTYWGVRPSTMYDVQVRAKNDEGESAWSASGTGLSGAVDTDVNNDGKSDVQDVIAVASAIGKDALTYHKLDVNGDDKIDSTDVEDLLKALYACEIGAAPAHAARGVVEQLSALIEEAKQSHIQDAEFQRGIANLELLLESLIVPVQTALLLNYPNPFNPETWMPYQLSAGTDVTFAIYAVDGTLVRTVSLGYQPAGVYRRKSRAAYWDGRNAQGERVASGVYFYTLTAGDFTATGKMLIRK